MPPEQMTGAFHWIDAWRLSPAYTDGSAEEQGLFRNLSDELWVRESGVIPDDERILAKASGDHEAWARCRSRVLSWMTRVEGGWTIEDVMAVRRQSERRARKQSDYREREKAKRAGAGNDAGNGDGNKAGYLFTVHSSQRINDPPNPPAGGDPAAAKRRIEEQLEELRLYGIDQGRHMSRSVMRDLRGSLKAGTPLATLRQQLTRRDEPSDAIDPDATALLDLATVSPGVGARWDAVLAVVEGKVNPHSFATWWRPTQGVGVASDSLLVQVPNGQFRAWLQGNYLGVLGEALAEAGEAVQVRWVTDREVEASGRR